VSCQITHWSTGVDIHLFVWEGSNGPVVCPVAERTFGDAVDVVTPYGFSGIVGAQPAKEADAAWRAVAQQRGWVCGYLQLSPLLSPGIPIRDDEYRIAKSVYVFDLRLDEEELFSRLPRSRRRAVHRWRRSDASFVDDPERIIDFGVREYPRFLERRASTAGAPIVGESAWRLLVEAPNTLAFGALVDDELVAINVLGYTTAGAEDLVLISKPGYQDLSMAFQWEGILKCKALGLPRLNIGGGIDPGDGVEQFKADLGALQVPLGTLRQVFDPARFSELCDRHPTGDTTEYFPPYRAPRTA
jgi:hypothetical protein